MTGLPDPQEASVRLFFPFRVPLGDFPGTTVIANQLTAPWEMPRLPAGYAELDDNLYGSLFAQRANGMLYARCPAGHSEPGFPKVPGSLVDNSLDAIGLFVNPQGCGALSVVLTWDGTLPLRDWLHGVTRTAAAFEWCDRMLRPVQRVCASLNRDRRMFPVVACRFRTYETFVDAPSSRLGRYDDELVAAALSIKPFEGTISRPSHLMIETLNPYHRACICDSGSAHFFVNSHDEESNPFRVSWALTSYAWIAMHELLCRVSSLNLFAQARALADEAGGQPARTWEDGLDELNRRLLQFLVYADVMRSGPWQPMREFHAMAREAIGAQEAAVRLKDTVATLQQTTASHRREKVSAGLLHLQQGLEWLEAIFVAYYALSITEHLGHAFHFSEGLMKTGLIGSVVVGLGFAVFRRSPPVVVGVFAALLVLWLLIGIYLGHAESPASYVPAL